ncbi:MAG: hypothetical protein KGJ57_21220 [Sphingomonadales bacterium]|nr:hypothetical protein [Sphingomonadales bacterium]MDE2171918.1 hypothetical protein [Sphingomonadales bacterium]
MNDQQHACPIADGAEYRLHWKEVGDPQPGIPHEPDRLLGAWIGSTDPHAVRTFALDQAWPDDMPLVIEIIEPATYEPVASVRCALPDVAAWNPALNPLPNPREMPPDRRPRSEARLELLEALRKAADRAVEEGILDRNTAAGLMLATRDALDHHAKSKRG